MANQLLVSVSEFPPLTGGVGTFAGVVVRELEQRLGERLHLFVPPGSIAVGRARLHACLERPAGHPLRTRFIYRRNGRRLSAILRETGVRDVIFFDNAARCFSSIDPKLSPRTSVVVHGTELRARSRVGEWLSRRLELERRALLSASRIWAVSEATADLVRELEPQLNVGVIHPCSDKAAAAGGLLPPGPEPFRGAFAETLKLLTVGRLVERKGHETVLRMLARLEHELPPFVYVIVGSGPWEARIRAAARTLGLEQRVRFTGRVPDEALAGYYAHADLFVMLPHEASDGVEGFGLVYVEAGAFGVPSVASDHGGAREAVLDGVTGITLRSDPSREDDMRFLRLARDGDFRRSLGEAARRRAADLSANRFVDRLVEGHHGVE